MLKQNTFFRNYTINKKQLKEIMSWAFNQYGGIKASYLADQLKDIGFHYATQAGISLSIEDLRVPPSKKYLMQSALKQVSLTELKVNRAELTEVERFQQVINTWNNTSESLKEEVVKYFTETDPLNSIYMMAFSGARGNLSQVRQLVGMRGLMADPNGQIIDLPITSNFREGLTITDYLISSYGARKGLVDTALRTADSGYLTRRLIDVAQDIITRERDCETKYGIILSDVFDGNNLIITEKERLIGRVLVKPIINSKTKDILYPAGTLLNESIVKNIEKLDLDSISKIVVRSPLTCLSRRSVCQYCYGWNLAYRNLIDLGEAVGIIAAQSIGEPGTQLTMRTFHTGGVFTSEPSRQVVAKFSGQIQFSKNLKTKVYRTQYGISAFISENDGFIVLKGYDNQTLKMTLQPETIIFFQDYSFVKKNDILLEFASQNKKTGEEKAFKDVFAKQSGEIFYEKNEEIKHEEKNNSKLLWLLAGSVEKLPLRSFIKIHPGMNLIKGKSIAEVKIINRTGGKISHLITENKQDYNQFEITNYSSIINGKPIYLTKNLSKQIKPVLFCSKNHQINLFLPKINNILTSKKSIIGSLEEKHYRIKTGGGFYSSNYSYSVPENLFEKSKKQLTTKIGGTILYIPEFTYPINCEIENLKVKRGTYVVGKTQLYRGKTISSSGIIDFNEKKKIVDKIAVKPGRAILITKPINTTNYHQQILYPGEIILDTIKIKRLSFSEIKFINNERFLWIYPIVRYEINNRPFHSFKGSAQYNEEFAITPTQLNIELNSKLEQNNSFQLVSRDILCHKLVNATNLLAKYELIQPDLEIGNTTLKLNLSEQINTTQVLSNEANLEESNCVKITQSNQYIEPYTLIVTYPIQAKTNMKLFGIKEQSVAKERKLILVGSNSYKILYFEDRFLTFNFNKLTKVEEKIGVNLLSKTSGLIGEKNYNKISLRKADPYLFSEGGTIEKVEGDIVNESDTLGQLVYERAKTGDIVQGLPRVEEILEARKPKIETILASQPSIVNNIAEIDNSISVFVTPPKIIKTEQTQLYSLPLTSRLLIGQFEFINVGQALYDNSMNPHMMLDTLFSYYQTLKILTPYQAAYRSLRKIQSLLISAVQSVYYSQGVSIADKHIEIIVKQMTGKVQVTSSGESPLLIDDLLELEQVDYINRAIGDKQPAEFKPILLGITKASLKTESFISSASFQHTTRILTEAAVQGKIDWLRGLKENVIVGRLIPSGTGFNAYSDISYIGAKIPYPESILKIDSNSRKLQTKYKKLKKRIKFV